MSRMWNNGIGAVVILTLAVGHAAAQQPGQNQRSQDQQQGRQVQQQAQQRSGGSQSGQLDKHLAKLLIAKNEAVIKVNEFAQQQAQDKQVKQYASQIVEAHQQLNQKLQQVAGASQTGLQGSQQRRSSQSGSEQGEPAEKIVQMFDQIESQFAEKLIEGLRNKQGQQLDNTVMGLEVLGHMRMIETLDVMQQQASGELQQILEQAQQKTRQHLQDAEQLSRKIEESAVAQRTQPAQQTPQR